MTAAEWVLLALVVLHFTGLIILIRIDPSNLGGRS